MKKRTFASIALMLAILLAFSVPVLAAIVTYTYTGTSFRYIGDFFHEKEFGFDGGGSVFQVRGQGEAQGSQDIHTLAGDGSRKMNLGAQFTGRTADNAALDKKVRIISEVEIEKGSGASFKIGVEMNPGESGYIIQNAASSGDAGGQYLKVDNQFGNTGGITRSVVEVPGYMQSTLNVEGFAEVWETTTVDSGGAMTGWWDTGR